MEFARIEKEVFNVMCNVARQVTVDILSEMDRHIFAQRDKKQFRSKGKRKSCVKTIYGDIEYKREMYIDNSGKARYLLDEVLELKKNGLYSSNYMEKIVKAATEESYRKASEQLNTTTGNVISHTAVWKIINNIGDKICSYENVKAVEGYSSEKKDVKVLFEEMDGVWLPIQGRFHEKCKKQELKVATIYEGWDADAGKRLVGKKVVAGLEPANMFIKKKDNAINRAYNIDEIEYRILNGDGGNWIKDDAEGTIFQLDRFHVLKEIRTKIKDKRAAKEIERLYKQSKPQEMLDYIDTYANSIETDDESDTGAENARKLYAYLNNNITGLIPYKERVELPEPPEGIIYKSMGVQENQNCTLITLRMKHGRMRWSVNGANSMAKVLAFKENGELSNFINDNATPESKDIINDVLSAAKIPERIGKANFYPEIINKTMPLFHNSITNSLKALKTYVG